MDKLKNIIFQTVLHGGYTYNLDKKHGYMVSTRPETLKLYDLEGKTLQEAHEGLQEHFDDLLALQEPNYYIGLWLEGTTIYMELSKHYNNIVIALEDAEAYNQIAIYNIETDEEIRL